MRPVCADPCVPHHWIADVMEEALAKRMRMSMTLMCPAHTRGRGSRRLPRVLGISSGPAHVREPCFCILKARSHINREVAFLVWAKAIAVNPARARRVQLCKRGALVARDLWLAKSATGRAAKWDFRQWL